MLYKDKDICCSMYYEEEEEVYKVFYTESGEDENGVYGSYDYSDIFLTREKAEDFVKILEENNCNPNWYSYTNIHIEGPYHTTRNVYLSTGDKVQYMIQFLTKAGYKVSREEK